MGCDCALKAIGYAALAVVAAKIIVRLSGILYPFFIGQKKDLKKLSGVDRGAKWAVVTGSTDGIGKSYAFELAKQGFDLILISRNPQRLADTAQEIKDKYANVEVKTIAFDFSNGDVKAYEEKLFPELEKHEIGVLVNNVGLSYEYPERMAEIDGGLQRIADITVINTLPATLLSAFVLRQMNTRKAGVIINLSSAAASAKLAFWGIYSASKKYVSWLSAILRKEYEPKGITIQTVIPMMVSTKMSKARKSSLFVPSPTTYTRSALATVGLADETTGYWAHQLQHDVYFHLLPTPVADHFANANSLATRARALKKKAQQQEQARS